MSRIRYQLNLRHIKNACASNRHGACTTRRRFEKQPETPTGSSLPGSTDRLLFQCVRIINLGPATPARHRPRAAPAAQGPALGAYSLSPLQNQTQSRHTGRQPDTIVADRDDRSKRSYMVPGHSSGPTLKRRYHQHRTKNKTGSTPKRACPLITQPTAEKVARKPLRQRINRRYSPPIREIEPNDDQEEETLTPRPFQTLALAGPS